MIRVTCYIRPHKLEEVKTAISNVGVTGMSVSDVRGSGNGPEMPAVFAGQQMVIALPIRSKVEVFAIDAMQELLVQAILSGAHTGEPGDGKVFIEKVSDAVRIRTEERGDPAV
jgi:nitrogen regulatory protein P-II 1